MRKTAVNSFNEKRFYCDIIKENNITNKSFKLQFLKKYLEVTTYELSNHFSKFTNN